MTNLRIHPEVGREIVEAAGYYQKIDPDLAERFTTEIYEMIERRRENRRCTTGRSKGAAAAFYAGSFRIS